jgi:hypothetical protein
MRLSPLHVRRSAPLPVAGRDWGRESQRHHVCGLPPSLILPRKGEGNGNSALA